MKKEYNFTSMGLIVDKYNGITIDSTTIPNDVKEFEKELIKIIEKLENIKLLWIKVPIGRSEIIPLLVDNDFVFYHCNEKEIMMLKRLACNPIVPTAVNHSLGVGVVVIKDKRLLVIKDRILQQFKLPGGYIDDNESISKAVVREVYEETGVRVEFESIVSMGHSYPAQFGQSSLYVVCQAKALSSEIEIFDTEEIIEARWMDLEEFFSCEDIHIYNKNIVKNAMRDNGLKLEGYDYFPKKNGEREYYF